MKKGIIPIVCIAAVLLVLLFFRFHKSDDSALVKTCLDINSEIKDADFFTAYLDEDGIRLLDREDNLLEVITYEGYKKESSIQSIRKEDSRVFFITSRVIDDEDGYVIFNDSSAINLDSLNQLERRGYNIYKYSTVATW